MEWQDTALLAAGVLGAGVALVHGVIVQKLMVRPFEALADADPRMKGSIRRLVPVLIHLSTAVWFAGGLALIAAAFWFGPQARLATAVLVGALYLYGVVGNFWATRGKHPGWMLLGASVGLIAAAVYPAA